MLAIPHLLKQPHPAIVIVTSGLAFLPLTFTPVYSATKAALHSFTWSLRHQLKGTPIKVRESPLRALPFVFAAATGSLCCKKR